METIQFKRKIKKISQQFASGRLSIPLTKGKLQRISDWQERDHLY